MGWVLLTGLVVLLVAAVWLYNRLIRAKVRVREAWAQVAVQQQRRLDLLPALVGAVSGYAGHEQAVLTAVTDARSRALAAAEPTARGVAEEHLSALTPQLLALNEANPQLSADATFQRLARELRETEDRLAFARDFANHRVASYRAMTDSLPGALLARPLRFPREELFARENERAAIAPVIELGGR